MKTALVLIVAWLWISVALLRFWPIRRRADVWPLTLLWPAILAFVVVVLFYEFMLYRPTVALLKAARS